MDRAEQQGAGRVACTLYLARARGRATCCRCRRSSSLRDGHILELAFKYYSNITQTLFKSYKPTFKSRARPLPASARQNFQISSSFCCIYVRCTS
eukprot:494009-Pleurochrysis_carterae.AAC.1